MKVNEFFKDLLVVELANVLAGPAVGMFFTELGAKVIKVENSETGGDVTRSWKVPSEAKEDPYSAYYFSTNWNKESHLLNLKKSDDRKQVLEWVKKADVVISNYKQGSASKLGMDYNSLRALNDQLIYAQITAYGSDDPRPGFDVAIQAETGWIYMTGEAGRKPVKIPVALMDLLAAHQLKEGILIALINRYLTKNGCKVSISLFDAGIASLANQASNWLNLGLIPQRMGSRHPNISPYGDIFYSRDDKPLIVATGTQKQFINLCTCLEVPGIKSDSRFLTNALRLQHRDSLYELLDKAFKNFSSHEILDKCNRLKVPVSPIRNLQQVFDLPAAQNMILEEEMEDRTVSRRVKTVVFNITQDLDEEV